MRTSIRLWIVFLFFFLAVTGSTCTLSTDKTSQINITSTAPVASEPSDSSSSIASLNDVTDLVDSESEQKPSYESEDLEDWVGDYFFQTVVGDHFYYRYEITIRPEDGGYVADLAIDGWQMGYREKADVKGDCDSIELILAEHLVPAALGDLKLDSKLLRFERADQELHTKWLELPAPYWNETPIPEITFIKEPPVPSWFYDQDVKNELLYTTTSPSGRSVAYVYTSTNPVLGKTHYLLTVLPKNEEFELQPANAYAAPKEFRLEWGDAYSDKGGWEGWENIDSLDVYVMGCEVPDQYKCRNFVRNVQLGFSD